MSTQDWNRAKAYVLGRLEDELPSTLTYHGVHHTRDDVLPAAERLAALSGITGEDLMLLRTAALYHDAGFLEQYSGNEKIATRIAQDTLPDLGYDSSQIEEIGRIILATQLPQSPHDHLAELMCDADLDSLGREDFMVTSISLWRELEAQGIAFTAQEWYARQLAFLQSHSYFSAEAQSLRDSGKQKNIEALKELLKHAK